MSKKNQIIYYRTRQSHNWHLIDNQNNKIMRKRNVIEYNKQSCVSNDRVTKDCHWLTLMDGQPERVQSRGDHHEDGTVSDEKFRAIFHLAN